MVELNKCKVRALLYGALLGMMFLGIITSASAAEPIDETLFKEIESNLMCTDGCGMWLPACENNTAQQMRAEIRQKLAEGAAADEIYAFMISIYGEEVMAAPPPQSRFNLIAWVLPFLLILGGGLVIYLALDKWVFNRQAAETGVGVVEESEIEAYEDVLEEETRKFL